MNTATPSDLSRELLSPGLLRRIEKSALVSRRPMRGQVLGARRSVRHGASVEFSDYRDYTPGDDPRYVDWKAYGRLGKLFVKLFREEDDLSLHLLLDTSESMQFGEPLSKLLFGKRLCAALGAVALLEFDRCMLGSLSQPERARTGALRGRGALALLLARLSVLKPGGRVAAGEALARYARESPSPGIVVVVSDFYDHALSGSLLTRASQSMDVVLVHVVSPFEIDPAADPAFDGDLRLIDAESQESVEFTVTADVLQRYRERFETFCAEIDRTARSAGAAYVRLSIDTPIEDVLFGALRRSRVVR